MRTIQSKRVFSITNLKGGTGKTTTTVNLAACLAERKRRVLLVDCDPQAAATKWLGFEGGQFLHDVLIHGKALADGIQPTKVEGLDLAPSDPTMNNAEKRITEEIGYEIIFRNRLNALPDEYDYILIDCPPSLGALTISALTAATEVLIPIEAHALALDSLATVLNAVRVVTERLNPRLVITGILPVRVASLTLLARDVIKTLKERHGALLTKTIIRSNVRVAESPSFGVPIIEYDKHSAGAEDYRALASEIINQERKRNE